MRKAILILLLLLVAPVHAGTTPQGTVSLQGAGASVDLITDAGQTIVVSSTASVDAPDTIVDVDFLFAKSGGTESFGITQGVQQQGGVWTVDLPVDRPDLTVGTWEVRSKMYSSSGEIGFSGVTTLSVSAANAPDLILGAFGMDRADGTTLERRVYSEDGNIPFYVNLSQQDQLIHSAIVKVGNFEKILPAPFTVLVEDILEGEKTISFVVVDRLGRAASIHQPVFLDFTKPEFESVEIHGKAVAGFPLEIHVDLEDEGETVTTATLHNQTKVTNGTGHLSFQFEALPYGVGESATLLLTSQDEAGNAASKTVPILFEEAEGAVEWVDFDATTRLLPNEPAEFTVRLQQEDGFADVAVNVSLEGDVLAMLQGTVPKDGNLTLNHTVSLTPGQYEVMANITLDPVFNQTPLAVKSVDVEVFLGKTVHGANEYFIRAGPQGLPTVALLGNVEYVLALENMGGKQVYRIVSTDAHWDPEQLITTIEASTAESSKETPFPAALVGLGLVAVALARRR